MLWHCFTISWLVTVLSDQYLSAQRDKNIKEPYNNEI